jgi:hypothetical protein
MQSIGVSEGELHYWGDVNRERGRSTSASDRQQTRDVVLVPKQGKRQSDAFYERLGLEPTEVYDGDGDSCSVMQLGRNPSRPCSEAPVAILSTETGLIAGV